MEEVLQELRKINQRLDGMDERFESLEEANQVTRDLIKDMELRFEERFDRLESRMDGLSGGQKEIWGGGQKEIRADIAGLERRLFLEEGSRAHVDRTQGEELRKLEKRVAALEAIQGLTPRAA
ncbi:MAG: hypothetical protein Q4F02_00245 [Candidatus Saccharibacteria bacterium]|nr:hypothetical protein [Candidatus Saccharibacteria bacterium]